VAAKHGLVGLTKTATFEYAAQNLRLNASFLPDPITPWMADIWRSKVETKIRIALCYLSAPSASFYSKRHFYTFPI
jgi:NAD(P)-dependent dehydrogenase (short-subunit alcohol dehydrogenase family)